MTTTTESNKVTNNNDARALVEGVLDAIINDGDGTVFHEDVTAILNGFGLDDRLYERVASTLEDIVYDRKVAQTYRDDPRYAAWKYDETRTAPEHTESAIAYRGGQAAKGVNFLVGLRAHDK